jgi:monomeric isocitrate dehydrogenase
MPELDKKLKHLDFIQLTITRMAANSFLLKAWAVTLVAALFALAAKDANKQYVLIACLPVLAFWILDAYYLHQEKLYRALYDEVRTKREKDIDFSLNASLYKSSTSSWLRVIFSRTLCIFYGVIFVLLVVIMFWVT